MELLLSFIAIAITVEVVVFNFTLCGWHSHVSPGLPVVVVRTVSKTTKTNHHADHDYVPEVAPHVESLRKSRETWSNALAVLHRCDDPILRRQRLSRVTHLQQAPPLRLLSQAALGGEIPLEQQSGPRDEIRCHDWCAPCNWPFASSRPEP